MRSYRPDVDGLRGIAILSVLLFHVVPGALPGGFAGVDVFFVISGFLITGIVVHEARSGEFGFGSFLFRRLRRTLPALLVSLYLCLALGWLFCFPHELKKLGARVVSGELLLANMHLLRSSGYFHPQEQQSPLLHLWSLGVEEQFYLVWPALILFGLRSKIGLRRVLLALLALSFVACVALTPRFPNLGFFSLPTRMWELLAGAWLAVEVGRLDGWLDPRARAWCSAVGLGLIAASVTLVQSSQHWPGPATLLPVVGASLVIAAGPNAWANRLFFAQPALVAIGLISYPLYVTHWPR